MMESLFRSNDWINTGRHEGQLLKSADAALTAIGSDTSLCIEVLDSVYGDERLVTVLASRSWIEDVKFGRTGREWDEERGAIAANSVEMFSEFWPSMRIRLNEALLVSLVGTMENYLMSLLVEFPTVSGDSVSSKPDIEGASDLAWQVADRSYRKAVKIERSTSAAWIRLCGESSIPDVVKLNLMQWRKNGDFRAVDDMVLLRNSIVHRAGIAGAMLAKHFDLEVGDRVKVTDPLLGRYRRACMDFVCHIDPAL